MNLSADSKPLADRLAQYAGDFRFENVDESAVREVKRRLIDSLGCAIGALNSEPASIARQTAGAFVTPNGARLFGTNLRVPPDWAAFANGVCVRYLDFNDTYLSKEPAHPSDNIAPLLAIAESAGSTGKELIAAIALAYEIQCRLCDAASPRSRGWDHVSYVPFSVALGASRLLNLDCEQTPHAGVAVGALRQSRVGELSHWKVATVGAAARQGVFAALLAKNGMTGPGPIFEGAMGFEKLVSGPLENFTLAGESSDLMILKTSIKGWPAEYHSQSAIEAALKLRDRIPGIEAVESVTVESHDAAVDIIGSEPEKWRPQNRETADHSLPYIVAAALADGEITERQFAPERFTDEGLLSLVERVKVTRHAELSAAYPGAVGNIVHVRLRDGTDVTERVDHPRGHAKNPMSDAEVEAKFLALTGEKASKLMELAWNLDSLKSVEALSDFKFGGSNTQPK